MQDPIHSCEKWNKNTSLTGALLDGPQSGAKCNVGMTSSGSVNESNDSTFTELCQCTFFDIIISEKFAKLCSLLLENFEGMKAEKLFDLHHINTRMKEKEYEKSPLLFQSDIQKVLFWKLLLCACSLCSIYSIGYFAFKCTFELCLC